LLHVLSKEEGIKPFAFADDLALFCDSVSRISPSLLFITRFSVVSGLGINRDKSAAIPTADPAHWPLIQEQLRSCPWKDLPLKESGTHLGILIGRDVTLKMIWDGPLQKATVKVEANKILLRSFSLSTRILFANVFIVSLFSYIALFFVLPTDIWKQIKAAILKFFPFNGTAYPYGALVCGKQIFSIKPALKDVWAFNVSLLAVRSDFFFNVSANYHTLPHVNLRNNMFRS